MSGRITIGSVAVSVVPSAETFADLLRAKLLGDADKIGNEVGDILRERIQEKLGDIQIQVGLEDAATLVRMDELSAKIDELNKKSVNIKVNSSGGITDKGTAATGSGNAAAQGAAGGGGGGWIVSLVAAAVAIAPAFVVAGVGVSAFAALAVPQIKSVTNYLADMNTNTKRAQQQWQAMTADQKYATTQVLQLRSQFRDISNQISPVVLQVFATALQEIDTILPELVPVAKAAGSAIAGLLSDVGTALSDSRAQQFFTFVRNSVGPDMAVIGSVTVNLIHTVFSLTEAMQPLSLELLHFVNGVSDVVQWLSKTAPWLDDIIILSIALYRPLVALRAVQWAQIFTFPVSAAKAVIAWFSQMILLTEGLTIKDRALFIAQVALDAVEPWMWGVLAAAAIGGLIYGIASLQSSTENYTATLAKQDQATGFNIAGYQKLAEQLRGYQGQQIALQEVSDANAHTTAKVVDWTTQLSTAQSHLSAQAQQAQDKATNLGSALQILQEKFGITQTQAIQLAVAAHVTGDELAAGGDKAKQAVNKIEAFATANQLARPYVNQFALDLEQVANNAEGATNQIKALTDAYNNMIAPNLNAEAAVVALKNDVGQLTTALAKSRGEIGDQTSAQRAAFGAFNTYIQQINTTEQATLNATGAQRAHDYQILQKSIPFLEQLASHNSLLRGEIDNLIKTIEAIPPTENVQVNVYGKERWLAAHAASGMLVTGGIPGMDSVPILAQQGEAVVPTHVVPFVAPILQAFGVPGFAAGGVVGGAFPGPGSPVIPNETTYIKNSYSNAVTDFASIFTSQLIGALGGAIAGVLGGILGGSSGGASYPGAGLGATGTSVAAAQEIAMKLLPAFGWGPEQFPYTRALWNRESGFQWNARNPVSGAYGIPQALPASKMAAAGPDWLTNPVTQERWGFGYIRDRYGSPQAAWGHELSAGWYDSGGWIPPGASVILNGTGSPEPVLSGSQWSMLSELARGGDGAESTTNYNAYFTMDSAMFESRVRGAFRAMDVQNSMRARVGRRS